MFRRIGGLSLALALAVAAPAHAQYAYPPPPAPTEVRYAPEQLDQMLAAIALYPDPLLTSILAAATYPDEVQDANQWLSYPPNAALRDGALASALDSVDWDPSVKSLVPFPPVLRMLGEHLDWTQALGQAFLVQQPEVMDSIQRLRHAALDAGTLVSTPQQTVVVSGAYIDIEPAAPQEIYIPVYNPTVVYGNWPYPAYLPWYYGPPPGLGYRAAPAGIAFGAGLVVVDVLWRWGHWDWNRHRIDLDRSRYDRINAGRPPVTATVWQHHPDHERQRSAAPSVRTEPPGEHRGAAPSASHDARPAPQAPAQTTPHEARPARPAAPSAAREDRGHHGGATPPGPAARHEAPRAPAAPAAPVPPAAQAPPHRPEPQHAAQPHAPPPQHAAQPHRAEPQHAARPAEPHAPPHPAATASQPPARAAAVPRPPVPPARPAAPARPPQPQPRGQGTEHAEQHDHDHGGPRHD